MVLGNPVVVKKIETQKWPHNFHLYVDNKSFIPDYIKCNTILWQHSFEGNKISPPCWSFFRQIKYRNVASEVIHPFSKQMSEFKHDEERGGKAE